MFKKLSDLLFKNRSASQTVVKNTIWLLVGEGAHSLRFIVAIVAARLLGAASWGIFAYTVTLAGMFTVFADIGIGGVLNREVSRNPDGHAAYLSTSFFLKILLVFLSVLVIWITAPFLLNIDGARSFLLVICLLLASDSFREFSFSVIRAKEKMEQEAVIKTVTNIGILSLGIGLLVIFRTPKALAWAYVLGSGMGALTGAWFLRGYIKTMLTNFSGKLVWPIFSSAWPFAMTALLGTIIINMDTIIIGHYRTAAEIGFYATAQRPIQLFYTLASLIASAVFPIMAKTAKRDNPKFRLLFEKISSAALLISLPITIVGVILGKDIIQVLFGNQYLPAVLAFQLLMLTTVITSLSSIMTNGVFAYDRQKIFTWTIAGGVLTNLVLDLLFIPRWGIAGSAVATIIAQFAVIAPLYVTMKKTNFFLLWRNAKKIVLASFAAGAAAVFLNLLSVNFFVNLLTDAAVYFFMLSLLKEPLAEDIASIFGITKSSS